MIVLEPDHTMHEFGPNDAKVKELIQIRNDAVEKLCNELQDTVIMIVADHGHKDVEPIYLFLWLIVITFWVTATAY